ncbi:MAG: hypothetical protein NTU60_11785 [Candidatus Aminicenantes bacterium]|nr:hypothetical protein [Candidatus Aminicenantes bacterium]
MGSIIKDDSGNGIEGVLRGNAAFSQDAKEKFAVETYEINNSGGWVTFAGEEWGFFFGREASILSWVKIDDFNAERRFLWKLQYDHPYYHWPKTIEIPLNIYSGSILELDTSNSLAGGMENTVFNCPHYRIQVNLADPSVGFALGQYNFIAVIIKNDQYKIFINNKEVGALTGAWFEEPNNDFQHWCQRWWVAGADWSNYWLDGKIDEIAVYNKALNEDQLFEHYYLSYADTFGDACDACPSQNAAGLDANHDGCIDNTGIFSKIVLNLDLPHGTESALLSKISSIDKALMKGNKNAALNELSALINFVNAQAGKKISQKDADFLIKYAESLIRRIQG